MTSADIDGAQWELLIEIEKELLEDFDFLGAVYFGTPDVLPPGPWGDVAEVAREYLERAIVCDAEARAQAAYEERGGRSW